MPDHGDPHAAILPDIRAVVIAYPQLERLAVADARRMTADDGG